MEELTIGEVARMAGIQPSALRYYESIGLIQPPRRINGRRRYGPEAIQRLALVQLAQHAGFTIAEIQTLFHGFAPDTPPAAFLAISTLFFASAVLMERSGESRETPASS